MNDIRQRTFSALMQNAILSPVSALLIGLGIILIGVGVKVPILNLSPVYWLVLVLPLWLAYIVVKVINRKSGEVAASQVLREEYDIEYITSPSLRTFVSQAIAYRERIDKAVAQFDSPVMRGRLQDVANQVDTWVGQIYALARRLDVYRNDSIISSDLTSVPQSIKQLQTRLAVEADPSVKKDVADTLMRRQDQLMALKNLKSSMDRAELQLENTITALGTVYSQALLLDARDVDSTKTQRLRESITEQVASLNDLQSSLEEVYQSGSNQGGFGAK